MAENRYASVYVNTIKGLTFPDETESSAQYLSDH
jgi:hypothetical protein